MQKLVQRVKNAERHRARQFKARKERAANVQRKEAFREGTRALRAGAHNIKEARKNQREDWATGALAPRRDVGDKATTYGSLDIFAYNLPRKAEETQWKWIPFRNGDRVVVTRGRDKGKIGKVANIQKDLGAVFVDEVNMADLHVPNWIPREEGDTRTLLASPFPIPLEDVRLVYPLPHPETGVIRDVVIDRLVPRAQDRGKDVHDESASRVIAGTNTIIPWPVENDPEDKELDDDTRKSDVSDATFRPHLLYPPMPTSVIDELRNKYSKYRTRHEWDFVQKMEKIDEETEMKKDAHKTMRTPIQELGELRARQRAAQEKELSREQLAKIGEVMALERAKATEAAKRLAQ